MDFSALLANLVRTPQVQGFINLALESHDWKSNRNSHKYIRISIISNRKGEAMGKTISLYLSDEALAQLDEAVAARSEEDRNAGATGRAVTSRSSYIENLILKQAQVRLPLTREEISYAVISLAEEYGAAKVSLFGSHARGDAIADSDVDLLVEKGDMQGLEVFDFQEKLSEKLGCSVDVVTTTGASARFLDRIEKELVTLYEAA